MACNFPGASNIEEYWNNLCTGSESISFFSEEDIDDGIADELIKNPNYIRARAVINDADRFDAKLFKVNALEARIMDPQHRKFLELAWHCLEDAGYCTDSYDGLIGIYAGMGNNTYFYNNVSRHPNEVEAIGEFQAMTLNEKDYLATRAAFKLNLTGPAVSIYSSTSTSLVAVCNAYESLTSFQCDIALAGGVNIMTPQAAGYLFSEDNLLSKDGHCCPFDSEGSGTVPGNGAGIVALKRLNEALNDGDNIYAVIKSTSINNNGAQDSDASLAKLKGQTEVVRNALVSSQIDPETISYIEANAVGSIDEDATEIEALTQAFKDFTEKTEFCAIGSVKGNIGHLDSASGIASFIKTVLSLKYGKIPPIANFNHFNPGISLDGTPFFINKELKAWPIEECLRRAGISSFGIGGTNAHVILESAPELQVLDRTENSYYFIPFSANSETALENMRINLREFIQNTPDARIEDISFTLCKGRKHLTHRQVLVCKDRGEALQILMDKDYEKELHDAASPVNGNAVLGADNSYEDIASSLYEIGKDWISGSEVDFDAICNKSVGKRISIPLYPFEGKRFWLDTKPFQISNVKTIKENTNKITHEFNNFASIEKELLKHPAIAESLIIKKSRQQKEYLIIYYVTQIGQSVTVSELRTYTMEMVSKSSMQAYFLEVASLTQTNFDSSDDTFLPDPFFNTMVPVDREFKKKTPAEIELIQVFQETLDISNISPQDNFYDLGGSSLLALQVISIIKQKFGISIDPNAMLLDTIKQIAVQYFNLEIFSETEGRKLENENDQNLDLTYGRQIVMNLHYFGEGKYELLGAYYPPAIAEIQNKAVVLCAPIGHEYIRSHWAFRQLSNELSKRGFYVLRFDYYATGDSAGNTQDGSIDEWLKSIQLAIKELKALSKLDTVSLIGLRFGATLACLASVKDIGVDNLVLWDPVVNGSNYLDELKSMHFKAFNISTKNHDSLHEMLGFSYPSHLQKAIKQINLFELLKASKNKIKLFASESKSEYFNIEKILCKNQREFEFKIVEDSGDWEDIQLYDQVLGIKNIIKNIIQSFLP